MRVKQKCVEITKQREAPFDFWERDKEKMAKKRQQSEPELPKHDFKANPIPKACSVLIYKQKIEKEEQARQKRVNEQSEISLAKSRMPSRMQKD